MKKPRNAAVPSHAGRRPAKVMIHQIPTGVRGFDDILGGGFPEFSMTLIGGAPGCGKTTLVHQLAFANATAERVSLKRRTEEVAAERVRLDTEGRAEQKQRTRELEIKLPRRSTPKPSPTT